MSEHQSDSADRVVITASELAHAESNPLPQPFSGPASPPPPTVPWWGILIGSLLTLCLPLLCVFAVAVLVTLRQRLAQKAAWTRLLVTLLIISGLLSSFAGTYAWFLKAPLPQESPQLPLGLVSHDLASSFPSLPTATPLTPVELAAQTKLLAFIVMPDQGRALQEAPLDNSPVGAAALLMASESGYLLGTNRHVIEPPIPFLKNHAERVLAVSSQGSYAYANVIAHHQSLDLALLWIPRRTGRTSFRQPITRYGDVAVGSPVYVIGHPQRLFFTLSSGIVSRLASNGMVQLSAPISPGNSGGPTYDTFGNLLGLVTSTFDKQTDPNAENLNFATRADAFLTETGWTFQADGRAKLKMFLSQNSNSEK